MATLFGLSYLAGCLWALLVWRLLRRFWFAATIGFAVGMTVSCVLWLIGRCQ